MPTTTPPAFESLSLDDLATVSGGCGKKKAKQACVCPPPQPIQMAAPAPAPEPFSVETNVSITRA